MRIEKNENWEKNEKKWEKMRIEKKWEKMRIFKKMRKNEKISFINILGYTNLNA